MKETGGNTNLFETFTYEYNQSSYIHIIHNVGYHKAIALQPDEEDECVWFVIGIYPRNDGMVQAFTVCRDGACSAIYGNTPEITKYPSGSTYTEGYIQLAFDHEYKHVIVIGTMPSKIMKV